MMTRPKPMFNVRPALAGVSLFALAGCAGASDLPCDFACTPAQWSAQERLTVAPLDHVAIFGAPRAGRVTVAEASP